LFPYKGREQGNGVHPWSETTEALAVDREHLSDDASEIYVRQQVKANKVVACLKTDAAWRVVDLDPRVAQLLREYVKDHTGLLFPSRSGSPRSYSNVYNRCLRPKLEKLGFYVPGAGAHCFRGFRAAQLQRAACPDDLRKFWLGHASSDISDQYALQLLEDVERRKAAAASVGLGFEVAESPCNFHYSGLVEAAEQPVTQ
jgi:integrase